MEKIYAVPEADKHSIMTSRLPEFAEIEPSAISNPPRQEPPAPTSPLVRLAISNLFRLGCLSPATAWDGGEYVHVVYTTTFGREFVRACSHPSVV